MKCLTRGETPLPLMRARLYRSSFDLNDLGVTSMPRFLQHCLHNELVSDRTCEHAVPLAVDQITMSLWGRHEKLRFQAPLLWQPCEQHSIRCSTTWLGGFNLLPGTGPGFPCHDD